MTCNYFLKPSAITSLPVYPVSPVVTPAGGGDTKSQALPSNSAQLTAAPRATGSHLHCRVYTFCWVGASSHHSSWRGLCCPISLQ